ncbi:hypothetical protein BGZ94_006439, partial [Podila epigama]
NPTVNDLEKIFQEYRAERYPIVKEAFAICQMARRNFGKVGIALDASHSYDINNMFSAMTRVFIKRMPPWLYRMIVKKAFLARYQVSFLPLVEDTGSSKPRYQRSLHKTLKILEALEELANLGLIAPINAP